jgi:hypothetical protein
MVQQEVFCQEEDFGMATHKPNILVKRVFNPMRFLAIAVLMAILFAGIVAFSVLAAAPAEGTIVEGVSVPGLALGDTRAQVEAAYGAPGGCQDTEVAGDLGFCFYPVEGGGSVSVWYQGADGRYATNSSDDLVYRIQWPKAVSGWTTTAGINTELAFNDRQAVVDAYPNAEVTYDESGNVTRVEDSQLGILVRWSPPVYIFPGSVSMEIYPPPATLSEGSSIRVAGMDVTGEKIKSERHVIVAISVQGEQGQPTYGATVIGTWTYPRGAVQTVKHETSNTGYAFFELADARNGTWTLTIDDVLLEGHPLDRENSVLSVSFEANRLK